MLGVIIPEGGVAKIFWSDTSLSDSAPLQNFFVEAVSWITKGGRRAKRGGFLAPCLFRDQDGGPREFPEDTSVTVGFPFPPSIGEHFKLLEFGCQRGKLGSP